MELYRKYRPKRFKDIIGQPEAVKVLESKLKTGEVPHVMLFTGPSGCGKTTFAYVMRDKLGCHPQDFCEINAANARGVDTVRQIDQHKGLAPRSGKCRIWLLDECQMLTKEAQSALLKMLEDTPSHVYFMLATTDPHKLLATIKTRCTEIRVKALTPTEMGLVLTEVLSKVGKTVSSEVTERIVEAADGSARKALVLLDQILALDDEEEQLACVLNSDARQQGIAIARALFDRRTQWAEMAKLIKSVDEEPETIRRIILGYCSTILLSKKDERAYAIIQIFRDHWYDCGKAGLVASCYDVLTGK